MSKQSKDRELREILNDGDWDEFSFEDQVEIILKWHEKHSETRGGKSRAIDLEGANPSLPSKVTTKESWGKEAEDYLFLTNLRWAEIHTRIMNRIPITPDMKEEYELAIDKLDQLLAKQREEIIKFVKKMDRELVEDGTGGNEYYVSRWDLLAKLKTNTTKGEGKK